MHIYKASPDTDPSTWERLHILKEHEQVKAPPASAARAPALFPARLAVTGATDHPPRPPAPPSGAARRAGAPLCMPPHTRTHQPHPLSSAAPSQVVSALDWAAQSNKLLSCSHDRNLYVWTVRTTPINPSISRRRTDISLLPASAAFFPAAAAP